jgi:hypothetical protein
MLKSIAFVCSKVNDGLSVEQISNYMNWDDDCDKQFISFCVQFSIDNNWLKRTNNADRYSLTPLGKEFVASQFSSV